MRPGRVVLAALGVVVVVLGLGAAWLVARFLPAAEREDPALVAAQSAQLLAERARLVGALRARMRDDPVLGERPDGDILIGLPTPFVRGIARDVAAEYFHDVDLTLRGITVRKSGEVHARLSFLGRRRVGTYALAVRIDSVRGRLRPGVPALGFGDGQVRIRLPVEIASGGGRATITLGWDSHGLALPLCGNLDVTQVVSGRVRPLRQEVRGLVRLTALDGAIVADPDFPELAVRLFIEPSERSLVALDSVLALRGGICGMALRKSDVRGRILELVGRGFNVRIPQRFFRPVRLPIAVRTSLPLGSREAPLAVRPSGLRVSDHAVWLGAWVAVGEGRGGP